jgi:hypothetical protein
MMSMKDLYGCSEVAPLTDVQREARDEIKRKVPWDTPGLKVWRLRLLSDPGFPVWDVSYCHGTLSDGEHVSVDLPFNQLPKRGLRRAIVAYAKRYKVYAQGLGILDNISTLC